MTLTNEINPTYKYYIDTTSNHVDTNTLTAGNYYYSTIPSNTWTYWYGNTIYKYQVICPKPRCKGRYWGELEKIVVCPKCSSKVLLTAAKELDYTVEIAE